MKEKFNQHFVIKRNVTFERAKFNMQNQEPDEPVDAFITDLDCLSEHCAFGTLRNELIRHRIETPETPETSDGFSPYAIVGYKQCRTSRLKSNKKLFEVEVYTLPFYRPVSSRLRNTSMVSTVYWPT